jgi:REP element-mobilizing transposase RayT
MITRRCAQRQFLLRPDDETNNMFTYCLGEAAARFGIEVIVPSAMSNHYHNVVFDRRGTVNEFTEHFNKMTAKTGNAMRGRWENFWSSEQICVVRLMEREDVMNALVYAATNPVKDGLVERVQDWPGVNGLAALLEQRPMHATRPLHFFSPTGKMPKEVDLHLVVPPELGDTDDVLDELRMKVAAYEQLMAAKRRRSGSRVLGRRAVLRQSWRQYPSSDAPRRKLRPRIAARNKHVRIDAFAAYQAFLSAYDEARRRWKALDPIPFPVGTYWLKRHMCVPIATA